MCNSWAAAACLLHLGQQRDLVLAVPHHGNQSCMVARRGREQHRTPAAKTTPQPAREKRTRTRRGRRALMQIATAVAATSRSRRRGQAAQTPGTMDPSCCLRLPHSALGAPDAPFRPGWSMTMASRASCRKPRPTHGRQPWPRRRARGPAAPPALAQHRSTHKACHFSSNCVCR
jgi:hypothetical protein